MKFIVSILLTTLFAFALGLYFDWWSIAIAAGIVAVCIHQRAWLAFVSGFVGVLLLWGGYSIFLNGQNSGLLAAKVAEVLPLQGNVVALLVITSLVGALVGGFAALTGSFVWPQPARKSGSKLEIEAA